MNRGDAATGSPISTGARPQVPPRCRYRLFDADAVVACLAGKKVLVVGDSTVHGIYTEMQLIVGDAGRTPTPGRGDAAAARIVRGRGGVAAARIVRGRAAASRRRIAHRWQIPRTPARCSRHAKPGGTTWSASAACTASTSIRITSRRRPGRRSVAGPPSDDPRRSDAATPRRHHRDPFFERRFRNGLTHFVSQFPKAEQKFLEYDHILFGSLAHDISYSKGFACGHTNFTERCKNELRGSWRLKPLLEYSKNVR